MISEVDIKDYKQLEMFQPESNNLSSILNNRGTHYGSFEGNAAISQLLKGITLNALEERNKALYTYQQEALDMIFHKIARIINGDSNYVDSWVDIAGYAQLVVNQLEKNKND